MGIMDKLVGKGITATVESFADVADRFIETPDEKRAWEQVKLKIAQEPQLAQIELNKIEAGHRTVFTSGWRPAIGWTCALSLLFIFIINPIIQWVTGEAGPIIPVDELFPLVLGMLGLGALRTYEKHAGVTR